MGSLGIIASQSAMATAGGVGAHFSVQGRISNTLAVGGVADGQFWFPSSESLIVLVTVAPALRLGAVGHATVALGPSLLILGALGRAFTGLMGTLFVQAGFPFAAAFGVHARLSFSFDASGVVLCLGFGFGGSVY